MKLVKFLSVEEIGENTHLFTLSYKSTPFTVIRGFESSSYVIDVTKIGANSPIFQKKILDILDNPNASPKHQRISSEIHDILMTHCPNPNAVKPYTPEELSKYFDLGKYY